jgi:hypothetical protein
MLLRRAGAALALASCTLLGHASIYKWVDDQGVTHYAQTPPIGRQAERIHVPEAVVQASAEEARPDKGWPENRWERAYGVPPERVRLGPKGTRARAATAERVHTCVRAHWNLRSLDEQRPFQRVRLEPIEREAERDRLRRMVWEHCDMP